MNCKKCGYMLTADDRFCKNCGASIEAQNSVEINSQTNQENLNRMQQPMPNMQQSMPNMQQSMPNMQQPMPNMQQPMPYSNNENKKRSPIKYVLIGFALIMAIWIIGTIISITIKVISGVNNDENPTDNQPLVNETTNYKVKLNNYVFSIPEEFNYDVSDGEIWLYDDAEENIAIIGVGEGTSYSQIKTKINEDSYKKGLEANGMKIISIKEEKVSGRQFSVIEAEYNNTKQLYGFTKASANSVFMVSVVSMNKFNYNWLEKVAEIINNAEYKDKSNSIAGNNKLNLDIITKDILK